jgi:hypothetical protein
MAKNEAENKLPKTTGNEPEGKAGQNQYHAPSLVHYGALAELVQVNPSVGPDGGTADCQHN